MEAMAERVQTLDGRARRLESFFEDRATIYGAVGHAPRARAYLLAAAHVDMFRRCLQGISAVETLNGDGARVAGTLAALDAALDDDCALRDEPRVLRALSATLEAAARAADELPSTPSVPVDVAAAPRHLRGVVRALEAACDGRQPGVSS